MKARELLEIRQRNLPGEEIRTPLEMLKLLIKLKLIGICEYDREVQRYEEIVNKSNYKSESLMFINSAEEKRLGQELAKVGYVTNGNYLLRTYTYVNKKDIQACKVKLTLWESMGMKKIVILA